MLEADRAFLLLPEEEGLDSGTNELESVVGNPPKIVSVRGALGSFRAGIVAL